jgi:AbrB family looped-hinge helix DNA binding protein
MRQMTAKLTSKGQITMPSEVRRSLGVSAGDRVAFVMGRNGIRVQRARSVVDETAGVFKKYLAKRPLTAKQLKRRAEDALTDEAVERDERSKRR